MKNQPAFHCVANLGDANPLEHGGAFVLVDRRGLYRPELHLWEPEECKLYRVTCEQLWRIPSNESRDPATNRQPENGVSDNRFHPYLPAWFGNLAALQSVADSIGSELSEFVDRLTAENAVTRVSAFIDLIGYWGPAEFDSYPLDLTAREAKALCSKCLKQITAAERLQDGF